MQSGKVAATRQAARPARSALVCKATSRVDRFSKSDIIVSPSILSADFARLGEEVSGGSALFLGAPCEGSHPLLVGHVKGGGTPALAAAASASAGDDPSPPRHGLATSLHPAGQGCGPGRR